MAITRCPMQRREAKFGFPQIDVDAVRAQQLLQRIEIVFLSSEREHQI
jgi:hypothetical protein